MQLIYKQSNEQETRYLHVWFDKYYLYIFYKNILLLFIKIYRNLLSVDKKMK